MFDDSPEPLRDVRQAAEILGVPTSTLYDWCRLRKIPHYKLNGLIRFRVSDLEGFLQAGRRGDPVGVP